MGTSKRAVPIWSLPGRAGQACYGPRTFHASYSDYYSWRKRGSCCLFGGLGGGRRMIRIGSWARHPNAVNVPMHDVDRNSAAFTKQRGQLVGNHHRTVPATGAPDGYGEVTFSFAFETGQTKFEQRSDALEKPTAVRLGQHEILHGLRVAREFSEFRHEVRIVQKSHVEQ